MRRSGFAHHHPSIYVHVAEQGARTVNGAVRCEIDRDLTFSTESLESYFFAEWKEEAYDALLLAAAVEFADKSRRRSSICWRRLIDLRLPVHDVERWQQAAVSEALTDALEYLTGDSWEITFYGRKRRASKPKQSSLELPPSVEAVIPFSDGLDSRVVGGLMERTLGSRLVRVRLASRLQDGEGLRGRRLIFTNIPYRVSGRSAESSARSRGFKFAVISGIAAYLAAANKIIVPESGQGALGPSLVPVGQTYEDYRSHPAFARRMERVFKGLFGREITFSFPQLWRTKGETLREFIEECSSDPLWTATRSCWQQSRQVGVRGRRRQCGICAACMLRRMSVHFAGGSEPKDQYVWERLEVSALEDGVASGFARTRITTAMREHAIAGALHLDHLASLRCQPLGTTTLDLYSHQLGQTLSLDRTSVRTKLDRLLEQHAKEWAAFVSSLGSKSFVRTWAVEVPS